MTIGKIIAFNTAKNKQIKNEPTNISNNTISLPDKPAEIIPIQALQLKSMPFNLELDTKEMIDFCSENGIRANQNQIQQSILDYYHDAKQLKNVPNEALKIAKSFEDDLNSVDFGTLKNIRNFYHDGLIDEKIVIKQFYSENYAFFDTDFEKSRETMTPLVKAFAQCIKEQLPEYKIAINSTINQNNKKICEYIDINKGDCSISFSPQDFLYSILNKKLTGDYAITMTAENGYEYSYTAQSGTIQKYEIGNDEIKGSTLENFYDTNGNPIFFIDRNSMFGPTFYLSQILNSDLHALRCNENTIRYIENSDEETLNMLAKLIENDKEVNELLKKGFPLEMALNCVRNGVFNMNVAEAIAYIIEQTESWTYEIPDNEYINNIINLIDTEDHYFEEDMLNLVRLLIQKEHDYFEDKHEKIYEILSYVQTNYNEKNLKVIESIASIRFISFDEMEKLFDALILFNENKKPEAMEKINETIEEYKDKYKGKEGAQKRYLQLFKPYLK